MRSFELDPARSLDTQNNLAWVLAQDPPTAQRALDLARRVTAADPANAYYWDTRAEAARRVGDAEDANSSWAKCMDLFETAKGEGRLRQVRIALRYATFLRERNEIDAARTVAMRARRWAQGTDAARDLDRFLGK